MSHSKNISTTLLTCPFYLGALAVVLGCSCVTSPNDPPGAKVRINPRLSEEEIRSEILKRTPMGTTTSDVLEFVRVRLRHVGGEPKYSNVAVLVPHGPGKNPTAVGVGNLLVCLGEYGFPGRRRTFVVWAFDKDARLVYVGISKERDSL